MGIFDFIKLGKSEEVRMDSIDGMESMIVQFPIEGAFGTDQDVQNRSELENSLGDALESSNLGSCDGGDIGSGNCNIFLYVHDVKRAFPVVKEVVLAHGNINDALIVHDPSEVDDEVLQDYVILHPQNYEGEFRLF